MRGPNIQRTVAFSLLLHITFFALAMVIIQYSNKMVLPSPYSVTLVGTHPARESGLSSTRTKAEIKVAETGKTAKDSNKMIDANKKDTQKQLEDSISEIASKKKIERIIKLRSVISVKSREGKAAVRTAEKEGASGITKGSLFDSYYTKITDEIRQEWVYPDMGQKNLEAVVSVIIRKDGMITVQGLEKSSGDLLFDRSVLKAVTKASPVSRPPYEMEMGIRFYP